MVRSHLPQRSGREESGIRTKGTMPSRCAIAALLCVVLAAFAASNLAFRDRVLAPALGAEIAQALAVAALVGAILAAALLWVGWKRS